jgi:hypothetical protein
VVVLPFVPVTDATGIFGLTIVKWAPSSTPVTWLTAATALLSAASWTASSGSSSPLSAWPRDSPSASPRPRQRHGNATTTSERDPPVRVRTPSLVVPDAAAIRRTTCATSRMTARCRCSESAAPGRTVRIPSRLLRVRSVVSSALR